MISKSKKIIFSVVWGLLCWVALEGLAGVLVGTRYTRIEMVDIKKHPEALGYFTPNQHRTVMFPGLPEYRVTSDTLGLRKTKEIPLQKAEGMYRILCVGDSYTFGLFIHDEETYPWLLQETLDRHTNRFEVLNAGIGGSTIRDDLYYFRRFGYQLDPDLVIVYSHPNDHKEMRSRELPYFEQLQKSHNMNWVERLERKVKGTRLYRLFTVAENHYKYHRFLVKIKDPEILRIYKARRQDLKALIQVAEYRAEDIQLHPHAKKYEKDWEDYFKVLDVFQQELARHNIQMLYLIHPEFLDVVRNQRTGYTDVLREGLERLGIPYLDLTDYFIERKSDIRKLYHHLPQDYHLGREGNRILVDQVLTWMKDQELLP